MLYVISKWVLRITHDCKAKIAGKARQKKNRRDPDLSRRKLERM
jgi:hypothetical protein